MPRYVIERDYGQAEQEAMQNIGQRMKQVSQESFPDVSWEHSHVVSDETGIKSFCVYEAPDEERLRAHGDMVRHHTIVRIYEIADTVTPADFTT
ncbi:MAG TPA: nickel-binding protein [Solirubrobacterales bacterium]|nr:nickel-binding protein [Solirubrobacterales bacterium]